MIRRDSTGYAAPVGDRNDCSVRALSIAANLPYERAHDLFKAAGRKDGRRTDRAASKRVYRQLGYQLVSRAWAPTVTQFLAAYPAGRFICHRRGHAFAVVDGVVHDWEHGTGSRSRVQLAYRVPY